MFGSLIVATGALTSCKDYDDDINANTTAINSLKSDLSKNVSELTAALKKCKSDCETAREKAITDLNAQLSAAKSELQAAIDKKADATTVADLTKKVEQLSADLTSATNKYDAQITALQTSIDNLSAVVDTKVDKDAFDAQVKAIQAALNTKVDKTVYEKEVATINETLTSLQNALNDAVANGATKEELAQQVATINAAIDKNVAELKSLIATKADQSEVTKVQAQADQLGKDLKALSAKVDTKANQTDLVALQNVVEGLKTNLSDLSKSLETLRTEVAKKADKTAVDALQQQLTELSNTVSKKADKEWTAEQIAGLQKQIDGVKESLKNNYATKGELEDAKSAFQTSLDNLNNSLMRSISTKLDKADFETFKKQYELAIAALTNSDETLKSQINAQMQSLNNTKDSVKTAYGKIDANSLLIGQLDTQLKALTKDLKDFQDGTFTEQMNELKKSLSGQYSELNTKVENYNTTLTNNVKDLTDKLTNTQKEVEQNKKDIKANGIAISELKKTVTTLYNELNNKISEQAATLTVLINKSLTSLVLKPAYYYGGIEALEVPVLDNYQTYKGTKEGTIEETWAANGNKINVSEGGVATYHVNPTMADLTGYEINFYGNDPVTRSADRGIQYATPKYATYDKLIAANKDAFKNGLISIPFNVNVTKINATKAAGKTPMVALQMVKPGEEDRAVASDYAMINVSVYKDLYIADNSMEKEGQQTLADFSKEHLFGQADGQAVKSLTPTTIVATHEINYADKDAKTGKLVAGALDLNKIIETHYDLSNAAAGTADNDKKMSEDAFKALGLKYTYTLIPYTLTGRQKSEDKYVTLTNGVVTVNMDDNESAKGHMPIVRVEIQGAAGTVLRVGYIKLKIAGTTEPVATENYAGPKAITCNGVSFDGEFTVASAEQDLYKDSRIDMTKEQFAATYKVVSANNQITQFTLDDKTGKFSENKTPVGTVKNVNGKYVWSLTEAEASNVDVTKDLVTYVKYTNDGELNAYLKLAIPANSIVKPDVSWNKNNLVLGRWYASNSTTAATSATEAAEIHVNPVVPGVGTNDDVIKYNMLEQFESKTPNFTSDVKVGDKTVKFDVTDYQFVFVQKSKDWTVYGKSGSSYKITVSADGKKLFATTNKALHGQPAVTNEEIATLSGEHNATITFNQKAAGKALAAYDILNKSGHKEMSEDATFKAYIGVQAKICDWKSAGEFAVRFLRPVDIETASADIATDAVDEGSKVNLKDLFNNPTDWRDMWKDNYWTYYGFTKVEADVAHAFTNIMEGDRKVTEAKYGDMGETQTVNGKQVYILRDQTKIESFANVKNANVNITYTPGTNKNGDFGYLKYVNNNANVDEFYIWVPVKATYDWGYEVSMGYAQIHVTKTIGQAKRR